MESHPLISARNDIGIDENLSEYFSQVFFTDDCARLAINRDHGGLSADPTFIEERAVL